MTDTSTPERIVYVQPLTRAHGFGFNALGVVIFAVTMFLWLTDTPIIAAAYGLLFITSAVLIFLGSAKIFEPQLV